MRTLLLIPTAQNVGLTSCGMGLLHALDRKGVKVAYCKPVGAAQAEDPSLTAVQAATRFCPPPALPASKIEEMLAHGLEQELLEDIHALVARAAQGADVVVVEGIIPDRSHEYAGHLNEAMAQALDASVVLLATLDNRTPEALADHFSTHGQNLRTGSGSRVVGVMINRVPLVEDALSDEVPGLSGPWFNQHDPAERRPNRYVQALKAHGLATAACILENPAFGWMRVCDVAARLGAGSFNSGDWEQRRVRKISIFARAVANAVHVFLQDGTLIVTPGDRHDVIMAASLATLRGTRLAGLLISGEGELHPGIVDLCRSAFVAGLPVLTCSGNTFAAAQAVMNINPEIPVADVERLRKVMEGIADQIDPQWMSQVVGEQREMRLSPPAFRYQLVQAARANLQRVVLPEGDEPRTVAAAAIAARRGLARPILLGKRETILAVARQQGIELDAGVDIVEPNEETLERYVGPMVELRKSKGLTPTEARDQLSDTIVLGTMMLKLDQVDGLVSGAVHTTAHTIRPALQLIKCAPGCSLVSSVFFMCLPDQVLVYGDCAVNPNPDAEQLADIAIQSARSAEAFGLPVRVAMISYSTGTSGAGADVEKVAKATLLAQQKAPELMIDGPLQYDAAINPAVGRSKAPKSPVAGRATVLVFPDLNTGNTTYKAVQRSADVISIGPMLQGMAKPVNDLSRGALVEDIVMTIALTAIQAQQAKRVPALV